MKYRLPLVLLFTSFALLVSAQSQEGEWSYFQSMEQVNEIAETEEDLWLATNQGVTRINKSTLEKQIYTPHNSHLPSNHIQTITVDELGNPWIGTYDVILAMFDGTEWTNITDIRAEAQLDTLALSTPPITYLYRLKIDQNGAKWIGTSHGLVKYEEEEAIVYTDENQGLQNFTLRDVLDITFDEEGNVYVAAFKLTKFDGETFEVITDDYPELNSYGWADLFKDNNGDIWFSNGFAMARHDGEEWYIQSTFQQPEIFDPVVPNFLKELWLDADNQLCMTTGHHGLYRWDGAVWHQFFTPQTEERNNSIDFFYTDQEGRTWLADDTYFSRMENDVIEEVTISEIPLQTNYINHVQGDSEGNIYAIDGNANLIKVTSEDEVLSYSEMLHSFEVDRIYGLDVQENGAIRIACDTGFLHFDGATWAYLLGPDSDEPLEISYTRNIISDDNITWLTGYQTLYHYDGVEVKEYNYQNSPVHPEFYFSDMEFDAQGHLWAVGRYYSTNLNDYVFEIYEFDGNDWRVIKPADTPVSPEAGINDMLFDMDGNLWFVTSYEGVWHFKDGTWTNYNSESGITGQIQTISQDPNTEEIVCGGYNGVYIFDGETWDHWTVENSGILNDYARSIYRDVNSNTWVAGNYSGLSRFTPEAISTDTEDQVKRNNYLTAYPNPARDHLTIDFLQNGFTPKTQLLVHNAQGQKIWEKTITSAAPGNITTVINTINWPNGLYLISVVQGKQIANQKILIQD